MGIHIIILIQSAHGLKKKEYDLEMNELDDLAPARKKISERLIEKLHGMGYSDIEYLERTYAGHWQRSSGAWRWSCWAKYKGTSISIGSCDTMTAIVKSKHVTIIDNFGDHELVDEDI